MKKSFSILFILYSLISFSQVDYSDLWEDFFSYNNVKDFYFNNNKIYAVCENAIFIYDENSFEYKKTSSVHGLSGETTSSFYYSNSTNKIVIGYENGLIEVIKPNGSIHVSGDIERLNIIGSKRVNHITQYGNKLYISTDFAIIEYDIENLVFGETFYIGNQSSTVQINKTAIFNNRIYAVTKNGIYSANVDNLNLIDFNNWTQPQGNLIGNFTTIASFQNELYVSRHRRLFRLDADNSLHQVQIYPTSIVNLNSTFDYLNVSLDSSVYTYNQQFVEVDVIHADSELDFHLNNAFTKNNNVFLATKENGILKKGLGQIEFDEIHPAGPLHNDAFSIEVLNNHLWVVYGGQKSLTFNFSGIRKGFSHFNGEDWFNTPYNSEIPLDLIDITLDKNNETNAYISSWQGGLLKIENDELVTVFTGQNSGLESWVNDEKTLVSSSAYDSQDNLWVTNSYVADKIKKFDGTSWQGYNFGDVLINPGTEGLGDVTIDRNDSKWIETRGNGVLVINRDGTKVKALNEYTGTGDLPDNKIYAVTPDKNNRIWIGTLHGLVRFDNASNVFELDTYKAKPIIIKLDGGTGEDQGQVLLGDQPIRTIAVDGADNKWFGTETGGVLGTNPSGQKTLYIFDKENSPLPSNFINKIVVDDTTGKVYFATTKGIVVYNNEVAPFGDKLDKTYAYPNPSTKENQFITIDGRNGTHLPRGTNVKILDSAGYLVYETNILEGIEVKGGKAIWNKKNLAGRRVASGVYVIMLSLPDKSETSITKVAIIN